MGTASTKIFQVCAISRLVKKKKKATECFALEMLFENIHILPCLRRVFAVSAFYPKVNHTCQPLAAPHRRQEHVELNIEENLVTSVLKAFC